MATLLVEIADKHTFIGIVVLLKLAATFGRFNSTQLSKQMLGKIIKLPFILLIRLYQVTLSPFLGVNKCRYQPTCSHYMIDAIEEWGVFKGLYLGTKRILRCHPWSKHPVHDPVPKREDG